jgi:hypothetical protein
MANSKGERIYKTSKQKRESHLQRQRETTNRKLDELQVMWPLRVWCPEEFAPKKLDTRDIVGHVHELSTR